MNQWSPRRVPGIGPLDAKIVIVGEAPGADEDTRGEPFVGGSGQLLNRMLNNVGLDRSQIYITNVVKHRPNNNNFEYFYEDPACRQPSQFLRESIIETISEIQRINPNVVIPLGNESLRALVGKFSISSWRGSILSSPVGKCVPTLHPAYVLRQYESKPIV
jgi:uracil-DNA glycosylase family 4